MKRRKWTQDEVRILTANFPMRGAKATQRILEEHGYPRTANGVAHKAHDLLLQVGHLRGYVPLRWVVNESITRSHAFNHAKRDGVLKKLPARRSRWVVPEWWADEYDEARRERADTAGWWTHEDIAEAIGRHVLYVRPKLCEAPRTKLGKAFKFVERRKDLEGRKRYHPGQTRKALADFQRRLHPQLRKAA